MRKFNLQLFATGENNNLSARSFQLEFKQMLQTVFGSNSYFGDFFAGGLEALDGVSESETAFYVKTSDIAVVVNDAYDTTSTVAFGTGTANSTRFGERTEIIYTNTPVSYTWGWSFHEGIDRFTVNNDFDSAIADRLEAQARAKTSKFNIQHGAFIAENAGNTVALASVDDDGVKTLFDTLSAYYIDNEIIGTKRAKVHPELYNAIVDSALASTSKNSSVNIDSNGIVTFKGFTIEAVPSSVLASGCYAYTYVDGVGKAFTGINTARTIESEDFDGVALQGAGKAGEFILPDNKIAVCKITYGA